MKEIRSSGLVKAQRRKVGRVELKRMIDLLDTGDLDVRIGRIGDPFLRDEARKLARATYVA